MTNIVNMVYTETNRPDLVNETIQAVQEATLSAHTIDYFILDIQTAQIEFSTADYVQQLDTTTIEYFRKMEFMRKTDSNNLWPTPTGNQGYPMFLPPSADAVGSPNPTTCWWIERNKDTEICEIDLADIFDDFWMEKRNAWYQAGTNIVIRTMWQIQYILCAYYIFPDITTTNYTSWIATSWPFAIVYKAAANVFNKIGQIEAAAKYGDAESGMVGEQYGLLVKNNITAKGF